MDDPELLIQSDFSVIIPACVSRDEDGDRVKFSYGVGFEKTERFSGVLREGRDRLLTSTSVILQSRYGCVLGGWTLYCIKSISNKYVLIQGTLPSHRIELPFAQTRTQIS